MGLTIQVLTSTDMPCRKRTLILGASRPSASRGGKSMRFVPFISAGLAVAAAAFVLGAAPLYSRGQAGTPAPADQGFVGAWRLTFDTPSGPSQSLLTVMADGTLLFSGRPVSPAAGGF